MFRLIYKHLTSGDIARLHAVWHAMHGRCEIPIWKQFDDYGGRGISVDPAWSDSDEFVKWAAETGYTQGLTLDRIDNDQNYGPSNCRWATRKEQSDNRRNTIYLTAWEETKRMSEWVTDPRCVVTYNTLAYRIRTGWNHSLALSTSTNRKN